MTENNLDNKTNSPSDALPTETIRKMANRLNPNSIFNEFRNNKRPPFAIFLGAGSSVESDISSASKMTEEFIKMICAAECPEIDTDMEKDKWLKDNCCYKTDKDKYGSLFETCYPREFDRREYIESQVDGKVPSLGYIALAHLIKAKIVDTILTTNFDDLVYIACTSYTDVRPVVYSLGGFASEISGTTNRPRVLKLHGDFLFSDIKNTSKELKEQDPNMSRQVRQILEFYGGLIVIGYSGTDDSIIELLSSIPNGKYLYWCVYKDEKVNENVEKLIKEKNGWIVRHDGFDKLFNEIRQIVEIKDEDIFRLFEDRRKKLEEEIGKFNPEKFETFKNASEANDTGNNFYDAGDFEKAEESYRKALELNPSADYAWCNLALIYSKKQGLRKESERFYRNAIEISPNYANAYSGLADLLAEDEARFKEAEEFFWKAIKLKPDDGSIYNSLGLLLTKDKSRSKEGEKMFQKAIELSPADACYFNNLGMLYSDQNDNEKALKFISNGVALNYECPKHLPYLAHVYKEMGKSLEMHKTINDSKGVLKNDDWYHLALLESIQENKDKAIEYLSRAIKEGSHTRFEAKFESPFNWIRDDPRFKELIKLNE